MTPQISKEIVRVYLTGFNEFRSPSLDEVYPNNIARSCDHSERLWKLEGRFFRIGEGEMLP